jgi:hypothetical protein
VINTVLVVSNETGNITLYHSSVRKNRENDEKYRPQNHSCETK